MRTYTYMLCYASICILHFQLPASMYICRNICRNVEHQNVLIQLEITHKRQLFLGRAYTTITYICSRQNPSSTRGPFLTSPLGKTLTPRGEVVPQGWICPLGVKLSSGGEILRSPLHSSKQ
jgi:hypothetical protein